MSEPVFTALVIEDERQIQRFVRTSLQNEGWQVFEADTVRRGLVEAGTRHPDLVILDLGLPDGNGMDFIRDFRAWSAVPIIVLSARTGEMDKIEALDAGADDYLTKPFGVGELMARVRAALRRMRGPANRNDPVFRFGEVSVDLAQTIVTRGGERIHLTPIEYRLLGHLIANVGKVVTHRQLLKSVWGPSHVDHSHYLRVYMGHLRHKLEADPAQPRHLQTETGVGYRLVA